MIKIEIKDGAAIERKWNDKVTGKPRSMRIQTCLVYLPNSQGVVDGTYDKIESILNDNQNPHPVGIYTLSPNCFYLDRNGRLQVSLSNIEKFQPKPQHQA